MRYSVVVFDNFHSQDNEGDFYTHGDYETYADALIVAKKIVDEFLLNSRNDGKREDARALFQTYTGFGPDPVIRDVPGAAMPEDRFSAWNYAEQRCAELFSGSGSEEIS